MKMSFSLWLAMKGIPWPELGVTHPAGAAWAVCSEMHILKRMWQEDQKASAQKAESK